MPVTKLLEGRTMNGANQIKRVPCSLIGMTAVLRNADPHPCSPEGTYRD
jgi:hypothetical protein